MYTVKIYGSNYKPATGDMAPLVADVEALSDVVTTTWTLLNVNPTPELIGDDEERGGGILPNKLGVRMSYELKSFPINFPTVATTQESLFNLDLLTMKYRYIWFNDYPLVPKYSSSTLPTTRCWMITITDFKPESDGGKKVITMQAKDSTKQNI